jgi:hypothetical protein
MTSMPSLDVAAIKRGLPDPAPARSTAPASSTSTRPTPPRSPRWCSTRWTTTTRRPTPTCTAASTSSPRRPPSPRGARARWPASSAPPRRPRSSSPRTPPRRSTWWPGLGRANLGPATPCAHRDRAPRQHRAVAHAGRRAGHRAALDPVTDDGHLDLTDLDRSRRRQAVGVTAMSNVLGTLTPVRRLADAGPRRRRPRASSTPASTCPTSPPTCRSWAPTSSPSPATRCSAPPASACSGPRGAARRHAAVPRRRRDDPRRHQGRLHPQRAALEVRGRHPADRRGRRPRRRVDYLEASAWTPCASTRSSSPPTPCARSPSASATTHHPRPDRAGRARAGCSRSPTATSTPTTSPRCSTSTGVRAGRPPLRQAAHAGARRRRHRPGVAVRVQRRVRRRRARRRLGRRRLLRLLTPPETTDDTNDARTRRPLPRDHPRPLPQPPEPRRARGRRPPPRSSRGLQPPVRRRDRGLRRRRRRRHGHRHPHRRAGLLDQPVVGVDDVGGGQGQDRSPRSGPHPGVQGDDVDPRAELDGEGEGLEESGDAGIDPSEIADAPTRSSSATSRRCAAW